SARRLEAQPASGRAAAARPCPGGQGRGHQGPIDFVRQMASEKKYHIGLARADVGDYVLVPGDPGRTPLIAKFLDGAREVAFNREYRTFTGKVGGVQVSTMSTGMGGPSVAIG